MEVLANELARLLNITVEKAIELYPVLKQQFIIYKIINSVNFIFLLSLWLSLMVGVICGITYLSNIDDYYNIAEKSIDISKKIFKLCCPIFIIGVIGTIVLNILKYILAPDFMLIKEFILK